MPVKIRHKQTGHIEDVSISMWRKKIVQELYEVIEYRDIVTLYQYIKKGPSVKKVQIGIVEKTEAIKAVDSDFNSFSYEDWLPGFPLNEIRPIIKPENITPAKTQKFLSEKTSKILWYTWDSIILKIIISVIAGLIVLLVALYYGLKK